MKRILLVAVSLGLLLSVSSAEAKRSKRARHAKRGKAVATAKVAHKAKVEAQRNEIARAESQIADVRGEVASASASQLGDDEVPRR